MRTNRVKRLLTLIQVLQSGRSLTAEDLAQLVGISRRTLFRDLALLAQAGLPYRFDPLTKRYSTDRIALLPPVNLSHAEALALMIATRSELTRKLLPDSVAAASAGLKIESRLPKNLQDYCGPLLEHIDIRQDPASDPEAIAAVMLVLQAAFTRKTKVWIRYDSYHDQEAIEVVVHPYRLAYIHRGWYLIGFTQEFNETRTYKIERILRVRLLDEPFRMDIGFNLDDYFGNAWLMIRGKERYHVKIKFLSKVASNVDEITWHKTQRSGFAPDGSLLFEVDVDGLEEISWWILGYGDQAQVVEPPELRDIVADHASRMLKFYHLDNQPA